MNTLQRALDLYCRESDVSDDGERAYLAKIAVAASEKGLLASDAIVEELRRVVALRPYRPTGKRPGLREWYITRLQQLAGVTEAQAVSLVDELGIQRTRGDECASVVGANRMSKWTRHRGTFIDLGGKGLLYTNGSVPYYGTYPSQYDPRPLLLCPIRAVTARLLS